MKPYASYKPSGVPWLGEVPGHWTVDALKREFFVVNGSTPNSGEQSYWDGDFVWVTPADLGRLRGNFLYDSERKLTDSGLANCGARMVSAGSLVISTRAPIGHIAIGQVPFATNQGCRALVPARHGDVRYMYYLLVLGKEELQTRGQGTTFLELSSSALSDFKVCLPPADEQTAIADYLDAETARIDTLIHEKDELIGLLREWRQSVIAEAVTKGLDKTIALKPSGVPWLGEVPVNWDEAQIRHVTSRVTDGAHVSPDTSSPDMPFVSTVDIKNEKIDFDNCLGTTSASYEIMKRTGCKPLKGDVLFSKDGTIGRTCVVDYEREFVVASSLVIISPEIDEIESRYLSYWLNSSLLKQHYELLLAGAALRRISIEKVSRLPVFLPTTSEQQAIADYLDAETAKIDDLIAHTNDEIALLKELRAATIADAVLGRVDVRTKN